MKNSLLILFSHFLLCCLVYNVHTMDYKNNPNILNQLLLQYASEGNPDEVKQLLKNSADVLTTDNNGQTALHLAAAKGHQDVMAILVDAGSQVNIQDMNGRTSLQRAIEYGRCYCHEDEVVRNTKRKISLELIQFLYNKGADITSVDRNGNTPLHVAVNSDNEMVVDFLLKLDVDVNATTTKKAGTPFLDEKSRVGVRLCKSCETPLHTAVQQENKLIVQTLLSFNANPNAISYQGTPLHIAVSQISDKEMVKLLLSSKADTSITNALQETALECAQNLRHCEVARLIEQYQEEALKDITKTTKTVTRPNQESNIVNPWLLGGSVTATAVVAGIVIGAWQVLKRR